MELEQIKNGDAEALKDAFLELVDLFNYKPDTTLYNDGLDEAAILLKRLLSKRIEFNTPLRDIKMSVVKTSDIEELIKTIEEYKKPIKKPVE